jgi:hypothetical protein
MEHLQEYEKFVNFLPGIRKEKTFELTDDLDVEEDRMLHTLPKGSKIEIVNIINKIVYFIYNGKTFHINQIKLQSVI